MEPIPTIAKVRSSLLFLLLIILGSESVYIIKKACLRNLFLFDGCVNAAIVFPCALLGYFYYFGEGISAIRCVYIRGFQLYILGNFNRNKTENDRNRKNYFYFLQNI